MFCFCVHINHTAPSCICQICFPLSCTGTIHGLKTQPTGRPIKLLCITTTFGSNWWRIVKHLANPERLLHLHQPCFCTPQTGSDPRHQPPPMSLKKKKKSSWRISASVQGLCKMETATGHGGHSYPSPQRKIKMSKDSGHLAGRGPGQAAVTHGPCQAATRPLQAGSMLTHSFARHTIRTAIWGRGRFYFW